MVSCFTTSSTVMLDVFLNGQSTKIFEVLFIPYKLLTVPVKLHQEGVHSERELVYKIKKHLIMPVFKSIFLNLIDLFLKTFLVLKDKSIKLRVINTVMNYKCWSFELTLNNKLYINMF